MRQMQFCSINFEVKAKEFAIAGTTMNHQIPYSLAVYFHRWEVSNKMDLSRKVLGWDIKRLEWWGRLTLVWPLRQPLNFVEIHSSTCKKDRAWNGIVRISILSSFPVSWIILKKKKKKGNGSWSLQNYRCIAGEFLKRDSLYWIFISSLLCWAKSLQLCLTLCDPTDCGFSVLPIRLLCPWDFPAKDTGGGCHALLQGIFLT